MVLVNGSDIDDNGASGKGTSKAEGVQHIKKSPNQDRSDDEAKKVPEEEKKERSNNDEEQKSGEKPTQID